MTDNWRKSTHSGGSGGNCVEAGTSSGMVLVRDTKDRGADAVLRITPSGWRRVTAALKR